MVETCPGQGMNSLYNYDTGKIGGRYINATRKIGLNFGGAYCHHGMHIFIRGPGPLMCVEGHRVIKLMS